MTTALNTISPVKDLTPIMGDDLAAQLPQLRNQCVFAGFLTLAKDVASKTPSNYRGFKQGWERVPAMQNFLQANDPAVMPGFKVTAPTLIVQGEKDAFIPAPLTKELVGKLLTANSPVTYKVFANSDHGTIVLDAKSTVMPFLKERFGQ